MPIEKVEFEEGKTRSKLEDDIILFLKERGENAFTSQEIMGGMEYFHTDFSNPEIAQMSAFAIANFITLLYDLVDKGKISTKTIKGQMYFLVEEKKAKCPKCGIQVAEPKKTWTMTGRPDKKGKRSQLRIGLFKCPTHGNFRIVLDKQKI